MSGSDVAYGATRTLRALSPSLKWLPVPIPHSPMDLLCRVRVEPAQSVTPHRAHPGQMSICLRACNALSGTGIPVLALRPAYARCAMPDTDFVIGLRTYLVLTPRIGLRARYAMSGTDLAYAATGGFRWDHRQPAAVLGSGRDQRSETRGFSWIMLKLKAGKQRTFRASCGGSSSCTCRSSWQVRHLSVYA
eukprot:3941701-Rhodomonas_salina.2